jgi:hypothetical protein
VCFGEPNCHYDHRRWVSLLPVAKQQDAFGSSKIAQQQKQIEALTAGLQKVSAAVELNKAAPNQVADNR